MNNMEITIKMLILLMCEYRIDKSDLSKKLIKDILDETVTNGRVKTYDDGSDTFNKLRNLLKGVINNETLADDSLLLSIELALANHVTLLKVIQKFSVKKDDNIKKLLRHEFKLVLTRLKTKKLLQYFLGKTIDDSIDVISLLSDITTKFKDLQIVKTKTDGSKSIASIGSINFKDLESVHEAATKAVDLIIGGTVLKLGWENMNTMLQGGLRRGESVSLNALPYNYKSSLTKSLFLQIALFNKPVVEEGKKPLLLFITLEEEIDNIMFYFYMYLKISLEGITITEKDQKDIKPEEVATYVHKHIDATGFHIHVERMRPDLFSINEFENIINKYEEDGYEIVALANDYAKKMSKTGLNTSGASGTALLELFGRTRTITSAKNILYITPHQLSTGAATLLENGLPPSAFVQFVYNKGMTAESRQLNQELDIELFLMIVNGPDGDYLSLRRGKHRIPTTVAEVHKYAELKFVNPHAPIPHTSERFDPCVDVASKESEGVAF